LLYGKGDFAESVKIAWNFGWDADCTAATVGTILGVTYGYRKMLNSNDEYNPEWLIVDRYRNTSRDNMPMDETLTSFADRIIELFEMVNETNGGRKTVVNNQVVYQIPVELPEVISRLSPLEDQKKELHKEFEQQILKGFVSSDREERARAAYMAVCLDMDVSLAKSNPKQWKAACADLSGYWKIMNNIFQDVSHDFQALKLFAKKFETAGFKIPPRSFSANEVYNDKVFWKDPRELYLIK